MNAWNSTFKIKPRKKSMRDSWAEKNKDKPRKARAALKPISKKRSGLTKPRKDCREFVFNRAEGLCEAATALPLVCTGSAEQVHEILARSQGGSITDPENCLAVCAACHSWITGNMNEARRLGLAK